MAGILRLLFRRALRCLGCPSGCVRREHGRCGWVRRQSRRLLVDRHRRSAATCRPRAETSDCARWPGGGGECGGTVILLASEQRLFAELKRLGKTVLLLTGDHEQSARHVAQALGIEELHAALKPEDKLAAVKALQQQGAIVAMIGDGVNDAPVLAAAQVSIAIGSATHITAAAGDMILLGADLHHIATAVHTARRALAIVRQNLTWAVAYNLLTVPAAAVGLITPWLAALGMSGSSLLVIANALRLTQRRE